MAQKPIQVEVVQQPANRTWLWIKFIVLALLAVGFGASALGIDPEPANCDMLRTRIVQGKASTEQARIYYSDC